MIELIMNGDRDTIISVLVMRGGVIFAVWIMVIFACFVDFWAGVSAAKALNQHVNSHGFRKTIEKISDYFKVLIVGLLIDLLGSIFTWYEFPYATLLLSLASIVIEGKSVMENIKRKKTGVGEVEAIVKDIIGAVSNDEALKVFRRIGALIDVVKKNEKWEVEEIKEVHNPDILER